MEYEDTVIIGITNWDKYNPKRDQTSYTWLRLNNNIITDQTLYELTAEQKLIWIAILCEASKVNSGNITINRCYLSDITKVKPSVICALLDILQQKQLCVVTATTRGRDSDNARSPDQNYTTPTNVRTYERTNVRTNTLDQSVESDRSKVSFDFEQIYNRYPRKLGKQKGMQKCKTEILCQEDFDNLLKAIDRYAAHCVHAKTEPQFIKHFATFMTSWRDWIDADVGKTTLPVATGGEQRIDQKRLNELRREMGLKTT